MTRGMRWRFLLGSAVTLGLALLAYSGTATPPADLGWQDTAPDGQSDQWLWVYNALMAPAVLTGSADNLGWVDTPMPPWVMVAFLGSLGYLFLLSLRLARKAEALVLAAMAGTALLFVLFAFSVNGDIVPLNLQPRYFIPFLAGLPLAASVMIRASWREPGATRLAVALVVGLGIAEAVGHYQHLLRYAQGLDLSAEIVAWNSPLWEPTHFGVEGLLTLNLLGIVVLSLAVLVGVRWMRRETPERVGDV
jgi:hypothetical protein